MWRLDGLETQFLEHAFGHCRAVRSGEGEGAAQQVAHLRCEHLVKAAAAAVEPGLYRCDGYVEDLGGFLAAEALDFAQDEDGSERVRELADGLLEKLADLLPGDRRLG